LRRSIGEISARLLRVVEALGVGGVGFAYQLADDLERELPVLIGPKKAGER